MKQISSVNYLPKKHSEDGMLLQDLSEIMDQIILVFQVEFSDIANKYRSFFTSTQEGFTSFFDDDRETQLANTDKASYLTTEAVNPEAIVEIITEFGYGYIYDLLVNYRSGDTERLNYYAQQARAFLNTIHLFKGHKTGLMFVLGLLSLEAYTEEWWETLNAWVESYLVANPGTSWVDARDEGLDAGVATRDTYILWITNYQCTGDLLDALRDFSRLYVYPILEIIIYYNMEVTCYCATGASSEAHSSLYNMPLSVDAGLVNASSAVAWEVFAVCTFGT